MDIDCRDPPENSAFSLTLPGEKKQADARLQSTLFKLRAETDHTFAILMVAQ